MTPTIKKLLSSLAVAVAGAVLVALNAYVVKLPEVYQGLAGAALAAAVHWVNAWGTADQIEAKATAKAADKLTDILDRTQQERWPDRTES